ncbi:PAS domain S-box protein [Gloeocapsopsis sp. IPPAS B-1203]|uniref:PAS domain S-box protein n=1 Tax=Gloeocapsopsis sp. IPPAS B-1203 TaxID=2049454 RepID=UPI000C188217|nr:PAS domain S-box protein [Gloeocapsopsis sp. IPPAS B-1203]PIG95359.1 hypothetical protein CSQ79_02600 [Gloeocapsopsis sp. IPPAS B-1203]
MNNHTQTPKANILVVDDRPENLRLLSAMLTQMGYEVRRVINGQTALKTAQVAPPDLILLDIMMPDMNGYEVCQHLKAEEQTRDVPVIFISALDEVFDKVKAFAVGGIDYITKPFSEEEVFARVENNLTIQRLQKQLTEQNTLLQQEIRTREKAEAALRLTQFYLDRSRDAVCFINADAQFVYVNEAACRILGYSQNQLLSMSVRDVNPNFPTEIWQSHWQEIKQKGSFTFESTSHTQDGRELNVEITTNYLEFNNQEYNCAIVRDITARKETEAALKRSETKFRHLFENAPVGIICAHIQNGLILEANKCFLEMLGYSASEVIHQKAIAEFFNSNTQQQIWENIQSQGQIHNLKTEIHKHNEATMRVLLSAWMDVVEDHLEIIVIDID